ncbi:[LysW]-lysine hydrolase [Natronorarus salvus]|uniref:[LysW]-lysine hydrolase n=1 Tax=Natronorarus salvus TaxID=3117733 RepID=UPI002F26BE37
MSANLETVGTESARDLLVGTVSIPSVSGDEREAAEQLVEFFESHEREAWLDPIGNVRAPGDDSVLLTSHVDTVPGEIPVRIEREDGKEILWGRGSVDATGPLCAMAIAAVETGVSFVGVVGEETDSRGARHLVEDRAAPKAVVNGEPSGVDGITLGYRGMLSGRYSVQTESAHTSRPEPNAIQRAMAWWGRIEREVATDSEGPIFESVTAKPVRMEGGIADDGLAVEATIDAGFRIPPSSSAGELRTAVEAELEAGEIEWNEPIPPTMQSPRTSLSRAFRVAIRAEGGEPRLLKKTGTSDMNVYAGTWDCPMVTYGPGDSSLDHAPDERLELAAYDRSIAVLRRVCTELCGESQ